MNTARRVASGNGVINGHPLRPALWSAVLALLIASAVVTGAAAQTVPELRPPVAVGGSDLDAKLEALIAELDPPSLEEVLSQFEPIPTLEQALAPGITAEPPPALVSPEQQAQLDDLQSRVNKCEASGRFGDAVALRQESLATLRTALGDGHAKTVEAELAIQVYQRICELPQSAQAELAQALGADARINELYRTGRYEDAVEPLMRMLTTLRKYLGDENVEVAMQTNNLGVFLRLSGHYGHAQAFYRKSVMLRVGLLGVDHPATTTSLRLLANVLRDVGNATAEEPLRRLVLVRDRRYGDRDPRVPDDMSYVGTALLMKGDYAGAEQAYRTGLATSLQVLGPQHEITCNTMHNLAALYSRIGEFDKAELLLENVLRVTIAVYGESNDKIAVTLNSLAILAQRTGDPDRAEQLHRESIDIVSNATGSDSFHRSAYQFNLARLLMMKGEYAEAEALLEAALAADRKQSGMEHPQLAFDLDGMGHLYERTGDIVRAESACREALEIRRRTLGESHPHTIRSMAHLACLLAHATGAEAHAEAEALFARAVALAPASGDAEMCHIYVDYADFVRGALQRPADALPLYEAALDDVERLRVQVGVDELERARYTGASPASRAVGGVIRAQLALARGAAPDCAASDATGLPAAYACLERGRALLDLLGRHGDPGEGVVRWLASAGAQPDDRSGAAALLGDLDRARVAARSAQIQLEHLPADRSFSPERRAAQALTLEAQRNDARRDEQEITRRLRDLAQSTLRARGLQPMTTSEVAACLRANELLLAYDCGKEDTVLLRVNPKGEVRATLLEWSDGSATTRDSVRLAVSQILAMSASSRTPSPPLSGQERPGDVRAVADALLPADVRDEIAVADRVFIIPDGPLHELPFELLVRDDKTDQCRADLGPPIVYGPSATVILTKRKWAQDHRDANSSRRGPVLVAVGDPIFARPSNTASQALGSPGPDHGVLLAQVLPAGNAAVSGLRAGDVLLAYDGERLNGPAALAPALQKAAARGAEAPTTQPAPTSRPTEQVPVTVWRDGQTLELTVRPGRLGVQPSQASMPLALQDYRELQLTDDERVVKYAGAATRDGFGELKPLPGSRAEIKALTRIMQRADIDADAVTVLAGEEATLARLSAVADRPRFLHFATHASAESGSRVYESGLALTVPAAPTPEDFGFLRLRDLLDHWGGKLEGTELVVLSGCQTARGRLEAADGFVGLTWGFLYAGADSVIASLWKVDDAATALLMNRLYENLLGTFTEPRGRFAARTPMPKADALHEAKHWLRTRTPAENRVTLAGLGLDVEQLARQYRAERERLPTDDPEPLGDPFDFSAPRFWAAFVLIGSPD